MKIAFAFLTIVILGGLLVMLFRSSITPVYSYKTDKFNSSVDQKGNDLQARFESGGSRITFSLNAPNARSHKEGEKTIFELSSVTSVSYEPLKENKSQGLKETIILKDKSAPNEFSFNLELKDVDNVLPNPDDGSWHFYNKDKKEVFYIPAGFMVDSRGVRSNSVDIAIKEKNGKRTINITADKEWLNNPARSFPVKIDPSVIVSGTIAETEAQFGDMQRKVVYAAGNWYSFYTDGTDVLYKKSSDGTTWGSAVDVDPSDADNLNPSVWLKGTQIYVAWIDDGSDAIEVNTINTASSDALGTQCGSATQGTLGSTFMVSLAVADDGTVYLAFTDTSSDTEAQVFKVNFSACGFLIIT